MTLLAPALFAAATAASDPAVAQPCPCVSGLEGPSASSCVYADPQRELRLRTQMQGPLTFNEKRTWKGPPLPSFVPQTDGELSLQIMDVTSDGYFAVWRSLYGTKGKPDENPRARARLYDCKGTELWMVDLHTLYPRPDHLELQDARYVDGVLYFNEACQSYAREAGGKCSWLVAFDPRQRKTLWKTAPLVSNGRFYVTKHYIVAIYAFTAESRFVRVLKRQDGSIVATAKLVGHHDWEELNNEDLHVRTEEGDEYFALDGLNSGALKSIRPHKGSATIAEAGTIPKQSQPITCRTGGITPKLIPVATDRTDAAFSRDGRVQVYYFFKEATLFSEKHPKGLAITDNDYINEAVFSPDSSKVALIGAQRGIAVHSTDDGHLIRLIEQPRSDRGRRMLPYGVQFGGSNDLYFIGGCQQPQARLFGVNLNASTPAKAIGAPFQCHDAWAAPDANSYVVEDDSKPGAIFRLDTNTGTLKLIVQGTTDAPLTDAAASTNRDWVCYARKWRWSILFCQNTKDGRLINLGQRGRFTGFSETGARLIVAGGEQDRDTGKERERVHVINLETATATELLNAPSRNSGGFPVLFGDGRALATPSSAALRICDVTSGAGYTVNQRSLFGLFAMPGEKPQLTISKERPDGVHGDLFQLELPPSKGTKAKR